MGAGLVAPAHEDGLFFSQGLEGFGRALALDARRVGLGADDHEVVVHDLAAVDAVPGFHKFFFSAGSVHQQHVHVAVFAVLQGLAGAHGHPFEIDARFRFELTF